MTRKFTGIDDATIARGIEEVVPPALTQRLIDNTRFYEGLFETKTWSWLVGDTGNTDFSLEPVQYYGSTLDTADGQLAKGFLQQIPNPNPAIENTEWDYDKKLGGLEFSTPPWEPMSLILPFKSQPNSIIDVYITCRIRYTGTEDVPMFAWAEYCDSNPDRRKAEPITLNVSNTSSSKRFVDSGLPAGSVSNIFPRRPSNITRIESNPSDKIQTYRIRITQGPPTEVFNEVSSSQRFVLVHFLSTTSHEVLHTGTVEDVYYRCLLETELSWKDDITNLRSDVETPGKLHTVLRYQKGNSTDHFYVTQQRPKSAFREGIAHNSFAYGQASNVILGLYPSMPYREDPTNPSIMQGVANEDYELLNLSYIQIYSISIIEKQEAT